jgi:pimeloyl-ACP methyl ester carboxylesterase
MANRIPHAELVVFEGCGHGHLVEWPEESIGAILEFLMRENHDSSAAGVP